MLSELKGCLLLTRLDGAQFERVAQRAVCLKLKEGSALFEQGDSADRFFFVTRGQIKLFRLSAAGNEKIMEIVTAGSTFAEALMFLERPKYPVGAVALSKTEVISIDAQDFRNMLRESMDTCFLLMGDMSQRLRRLIAEIDELTLHSATSRVAGYLLRQAPAKDAVFWLDVRKRVLASRLSVKPETFSRIIRHLSDRSIIAISGSQVRILKPRVLEGIAETAPLGTEQPMRTSLACVLDKS